ncbi:unnamed protein product [Amoebophrya sp. A120]|nr:unnamed protein product [Amoebophrya sp. A120]|eukprot:GSA120T00003396001.1
MTADSGGTSTPNGTSGGAGSNFLQVSARRSSENVPRQITATAGAETRVALQGALRAAGIDNDEAEDSLNMEDGPSHGEEESKSLQDLAIETAVTLSFVIFLGSAVGGMNVLFHKMVLYGDKAVDFIGNLVDPSETAGFVIYKIVVAGLGSSVVGYITRTLFPECIGGGTIATKISLAIGSPIPFRVGICRLILSSLYVASGNPLGIEAPTIHLSAAVASAVYSYTNIEHSYFPNSKFLPPLPQLKVPLCMVLGCCGGLSAAFNSPLSGIVFAIEEYVDIRQEGIVTTLVLLASLCSALLTRLTMSGPLFPIEANHLDDYNTIPWGTLPAALFTSILAGICLPLFATSVIRFRAFWYLQPYVHERYVGLASGVSAALVGALVFLVADYRGVWGQGSDSVTKMIDQIAAKPREVDGAEVGYALLFFFGKLLACSLAFSAGGSGGILMPIIICGGTMGYVVRGIIFSLWGYESGQTAVAFGMASFFAALTRLPLTATVLSCEMSAILTVDENLIFPILLASILGARISGLFQSHTVFERMMLQDGINPMTIGEQIQRTCQVEKKSGRTAVMHGRRSAIATDDLLRGSLASQKLEQFFRQSQAQNANATTTPAANKSYSYPREDSSDANDDESEYSTSLHTSGHGRGQSFRSRRSGNGWEQTGGSKKNSIRSSIHSLLSPSPSLFTVGASPSMVVQFNAVTAGLAGAAGGSQPRDHGRMSENITLLYRAMEHKAAQASRRASRNSTAPPLDATGVAILRDSLIHGTGIGQQNAQAQSPAFPNDSRVDFALPGAARKQIAGGSRSSSATGTGIASAFAQPGAGNGAGASGADDGTIFRFLTVSAQEAVRNTINLNNGDEPSREVSFPPSSSIPEEDASVQNIDGSRTLLDDENDRRLSKKTPEPEKG